MSSSASASGICGANSSSTWKGIIEAYRRYLPVGPQTPVISLLEGNTPLLETPKLSKRLGRGARVFVKYEGLNPTASFKDRGMTVAISLAMERGAKRVVCASTGNTSASAAAYAARAGIPCVVLLPDRKVAKGKLAQAMMYGASCLGIEGSFDAALQIVRELGNDPSFAVVNSINPDRIEGQKTASFEIIEALGDAPDFHLLPVGNAGNITAYWRGYCEWAELGRSKCRPKMLGFQAAGAAPLVLNQVVAEPKTVATAIQIGNPASWKSAIQARDDSGGRIEIVTDEEILRAQRLLASEEGIFVEPASAASIAGLLKIAGGEIVGVKIPDDATLVCTVTGHGLKDPDTALANAGSMATCAPSLSAVLERIR